MQTESRMKRFPVAQFTIARWLAGDSRLKPEQSLSWLGRTTWLATILLAGFLGLATQASPVAAQDPTLQNLFEERCHICHKKLMGIARKKLTAIDGRLYGRYTDRDIAEFMTHHGRLSDEEVELIVEELHRLTGENLQ